MALAGRSVRRSAGARWIAAGVVITLVVLLLDASLHSRSPGPRQQLAVGVWVDRALPVIAASNTEGSQLAALWTNGLSWKTGSVSSEIDQIATGASQSYSQLVGLNPPVTLAGASGLLESCLLARSQAVSILKTVFDQSIAGNAGAPDLTSAVQNAGNDLQVADQAYRLFLTAIPRNAVNMPPSQWLSDPGPYQSQAAQVFLTSLHSAASSTPLHQLTIYAVTTTPAPVATSGSAEMLPDAKAMTVTVVVADTGNQPEKNLTVVAAISPSSGASSARDFLDLVPGQAHTEVNLGPLNPPQGTDVTLTVTVTPPAGSPTPVATKAIVFSMPAPPPPSTTTTAPPTTSAASHG